MTTKIEIDNYPSSLQSEQSNDIPEYAMHALNSIAKKRNAAKNGLSHSNSNNNNNNGHQFVNDENDDEEDNELDGLSTRVLPSYSLLSKSYHSGQGSLHIRSSATDLMSNSDIFSSSTPAFETFETTVHLFILS